jgi:hypothetical protein
MFIHNAGRVSGLGILGDEGGERAFATARHADQRHLVINLQDGADMANQSGSCDWSVIYLGDWRGVPCQLGQRIVDEHHFIIKEFNAHLGIPPSLAKNMFV